jgi:NhaP-type Na+/H+ or K+/H+ antiporter
MRARTMWETVTFLIGGLVFMLIGVQTGRLLPTLWRGGDLSLLLVAGVVSATVIVVRVCGCSPLRMCRASRAASFARAIRTLPGAP